MGVIRLLGGFAGITALLAVLALALLAGMWIVLFTVKRFSLIGRRHRHDRWHEDQRDGAASLTNSAAHYGRISNV